MDQFDHVTADIRLTIPVLISLVVALTVLVRAFTGAA